MNLAGQHSGEKNKAFKQAVIEIQGKCESEGRQSILTNDFVRLRFQNSRVAMRLSKDLGVGVGKEKRSSFRYDLRKKTISLPFLSS